MPAPDRRDRCPRSAPASASRSPARRSARSGIITPWNFPIAIPAWKIAPALAWGNTVVIKPADLVPGCTWAIVDILHRAGLPKGVLNLVMGRGSTVGQALLDSPDIRAISFTGSAGTGRRVAEASIKVMRKFQLEMGGKNPMVVLDDADLEVAVEACLNGAFFSTGQRCTASSRLIVTDGIHDRFVARLSERMAALKVGDPLDASVQIGPVVDQSQLDQDEGYIKLGTEEGAELVGGERLKRDTEGFFLAPALFVGATNAMRIQPRGDLRPGRQRDPRQGLRRGARHRQRHRVRPLLRHLHHLAEVCDPLQAQRRGRHGHGQPAHRRRRLPRPLRRLQGLELRRRASRAATPPSSTPRSRPPTPALEPTSAR